MRLDGASFPDEIFFVAAVGGNTAEVSLPMVLKMAAQK